MINRSKILLFSLIMTLLTSVLISCGDDDDDGPVEAESIDIVYVENITATSGSSGVEVDVSFSNVTPLSALEVPLRVSGTGFTIDSVSFADSRVAWVDDTVSTILYDDNSVILAAIEYDSLITEGEGLLGRIYFTLNSASRGQVLTIDTVSIEMGSIYHTLVYEDTSTAVQEFIPFFESGEISVLY